MVRLFILLTAAFFAAYALADETQATRAPEGKEQSPLTILSVYVEKSRLGYTFVEMEIRPNEKIIGLNFDFDWFGKYGVGRPMDSPWDKGQPFSWSNFWDGARPLKVFKGSIVGMQVLKRNGGVKQIPLEKPIAFEAKVVERPAVKGKLDMSRLKDANVRTAAEVVAFFEKDGTYKPEENRIYTLKELRSILGEPQTIHQAIAGRTPMPQVFPPGFDAARIARLRAAVAASNVGFPSRNLVFVYQCRDGVAAADLKQLDYHDNDDINDTIELRIHTVQAPHGEKQAPAGH
jgi:hypothetical protein